MGDREDANFVQRLRFPSQRDRVRYYQFLQDRLTQAGDRWPREHGVRAAREHSLCTGFMERGGGGREGAGGIDHVIDKDRDPTFDLTDDMHLRYVEVRLAGSFHFLSACSAFIDDR